jgi:hypothetical protein
LDIYPIAAKGGRLKGGIPAALACPSPLEGRRRAVSDRAREGGRARSAKLKETVMSY